MSCPHPASKERGPKTCGGCYAKEEGMISTYLYLSNVAGWVCKDLKLCHIFKECFSLWENKGENQMSWKHNCRWKASTGTGICPRASTGLRWPSAWVSVSSWMFIQVKEWAKETKPAALAGWGQPAVFFINQDPTVSFHSGQTREDPDGMPNLAWGLHRGEMGKFLAIIPHSWGFGDWNPQ